MPQAIRALPALATDKTLGEPAGRFADLRASAQFRRKPMESEKEMETERQESTEPERKARTVEEIDAEIEQVKKELAECKGTGCEVYTRIVGYYRALKNWNAGKREEYKQRRVFVADDRKAVRRFTEAERRLFERQDAEMLCGNETAGNAHVEKEAAI